MDSYWSKWFHSPNVYCFKAGHNWFEGSVILFSSERGMAWVFWGKSEENPRHARVPGNIKYILLCATELRNTCRLCKESQLLKSSCESQLNAVCCRMLQPHNCRSTANWGNFLETKVCSDGCKLVFLIAVLWSWGQIIAYTVCQARHVCWGWKCQTCQDQGISKQKNNIWKSPENISGNI